MEVSDLRAKIVVDGAPTAVQSFARVGDASTKAAGAIDKSGSAISKAWTAVGPAVGLAAAAGTAAVAGLAGAAINAAAGFEQGLSNIKAVSGATADEMRQISGLALQLGKDTSFSAGAAAAGIEELIKGGVAISDVMGGAAQSTLDLAAAGGVDLASAAEIAANALSIFNLEGKDMAFVSDRIAGAANASSLSVTDFQYSMAAAGSVMAATGQDFDDLSQSIAVMGANGLKGSDAGTSLKTMFMNLQPTTKAQIAQFRELGLVTEDGANAFINANGSFKSAAEIAGILQGATNDLTEAQRIQALETMFGADAVRAATVFVKEGAAGFDQMAASMGKVTAQSVAADRLDNLRGDLEQLGGSLETAGIAATTVFLPALRDLAQGATGAVNAAIPLIEAWGPRLVDGVQDVAGVISDYAVPAMSALAAGTTAYAVTALPGMTRELVIATRALYAKGVAATAAFAPFIGIGALVGGAVLALKGMQDNLDDLTRTTLAQNEAFVELENLLGGIESFGSAGVWDAERQSAADLTEQLGVLRDRRAEIEEQINDLRTGGTGLSELGAIGDVLNAPELEKARESAMLLDAEIARLSEGLIANRAAAESSVASFYALESSTAVVVEATTAAAGAIALTEEELTKLSAAVQSNAETMTTALGTMLAGESEVRASREQLTAEHWARIAEIEKGWAEARTGAQMAAVQALIDEENRGYQQRMADAAVAQGQELAQQRAHLGTLLIERATALAEMNGVSAERLAELTGRIRTEYGVQESLAQTTFANIGATMDAWATNSSVSAESVIGDLSQATSTAEITQRTMDALAKEYTAKFINDFAAGRITADELSAAIARVPAMVRSTLETNWRSELEAIRSVGDAVSKLPTSKLIQIEAIVDDQVRRRSPAPIEQVMSAVDAFSKRRHVIRIDTEGSIFGGDFTGAIPNDLFFNVVPKRMREMVEGVEKPAREGGTRFGEAFTGAIPEGLDLDFMPKRMYELARDLVKPAREGGTRFGIEYQGNLLDNIDKQVILRGIQKVTDANGVARQNGMMFGNQWVIAAQAIFDSAEFTLPAIPGGGSRYTPITGGGSTSFGDNSRDYTFAPKTPIPTGPRVDGNTPNEPGQGYRPASVNTNVYLDGQVIARATSRHTGRDANWRGRMA